MENNLEDTVNYPQFVNYSLDPTKQKEMIQGRPLE